MASSRWDAQQNQELICTVIDGLNLEEMTKEQLSEKLIFIKGICKDTVDILEENY